MKILFLAPEPFFQERGTPIAVRLAVEVLAQRAKDRIDLITYDEGTPISIPNVNQMRAPKPSYVKDIGPGISFKKLAYDFYFLVFVFKTLWKNRKQQYDLIHAVEESVFIAWLFKFLFGIPYIYDMDSSLALQVTEKWYLLRPLSSVLGFFEKIVIRHSLAVVPVCDALAEIANRHGSKDTHILRDISLLDRNMSVEERQDLKQELNLANNDLIVLYIGNLESYQGIDLLVEGFAHAASYHKNSHVVIIGGISEHIDYYTQKAEKLGLAERVHLVGPRPMSSLRTFLLQADILVTPRTKGNNTPMKIYSYLHSGKAILATDLATHTQVLNDNVAKLAKARPQAFGSALLELLDNDQLRLKLGQAAHALAEENYTYEVFTQRLNELYDRVGQKVGQDN